MLNSWEYQGTNRIRVICVDGTVLEGRVLTVEDAEENEGDTEDCFVLETANGACFGLYPTEIHRIEQF